MRVIRMVKDKAYDVFGITYFDDGTVIVSGEEFGVVEQSGVSIGMVHGDRAANPSVQPYVDAEEDWELERDPIQMGFSPDDLKLLKKHAAEIGWEE